MPSHPEAVPEIRSAFRRGDISRAEAERLLRAEGVTDDTIINAMLNAEAATVARQGLVESGFARPTGEVAQVPSGPDLRQDINAVNPRFGPVAPPNATQVDPFLQALTDTTARAQGIVTGAAQQRPAPPGEEPFEDPFTRLRRLAEERAAREKAEREAREAEARRLAEEEARRLAEEELRRRQPEGSQGGGGRPPPGTGSGDPEGDPETALGGAPPADRPLTFLELQQQESRTRGGRGRLFDQFLAGQGNISNLARQTLGQKFNPLSAAFVLKNILNPGAPAGDQQAGQLPGISNFAGFLGGGGNVLGSQGFLDALGQLSGVFGAGANNVQQTQATALTDDVLAQNIISSGFASQFNPFLRDSARQVAGQNVAQFQGQNTDVLPLFQAFLQGQLGGGQGQFFGGF